MNIGKKIQKLRKERNLSQEQLAEKFGVSRQSVSKWESDHSVPDIHNLVQLSEQFGVTTDYFLKDNCGTEELDTAVKQSKHSFHKHLTAILASGLVVSILAGCIFFGELRNYKNNTRSVMKSIHNEYYVNLIQYNDLLKSRLKNQGNHTELTSRTEIMRNHVDVLISSAGDYIKLSEEMKGEILGAYLWDMATSTRWMLREYFLESDGVDIKGDFRGIDREKIAEVTSVIDEIIELEEMARYEMESSGERYDSKEMAEALQPKLTELTDLTILSISEHNN